MTGRCAPSSKLPDTPNSSTCGGKTGYTRDSRLVQRLREKAE